MHKRSVVMWRKEPMESAIDAELCRLVDMGAIMECVQGERDSFHTT